MKVKTTEHTNNIQTRIASVDIGEDKTMGMDKGVKGTAPPNKVINRGAIALKNFRLTEKSEIKENTTSVQQSAEKQLPLTAKGGVGVTEQIRTPSQQLGKTAKEPIRPSIRYPINCPDYDWSKDEYHSASEELPEPEPSKK